jgi:hypothetical protein
VEIILTDRVTNEVVMHRVRKERNIVHSIKRRKVDWIGHILHRNCHLKHAIYGNIEGMIEVKGRRGGMYKQLLDDLKQRGHNGI